MLTTTCEQEIQWLGLRFAVPAAWQVVRHSLTPQRGGLVLVDRYRQRMQLNWTTLPDLAPGSLPDLAHMIGDYRAKQLEAQPNARLADLLGPGDWLGVTRAFGDDAHLPNRPRGARGRSSPTAEALAVTRAVRFDEPSGRLLEAIVHTDPADPEEEGLLEALLESVQAVEPIDAVTRLRCFDLDITVPTPQWRLTHTDVKPADVTLRYEHADENGRETRQELVVRRLGMADTWWHGDAARFITRTSPKVRFTLDERTYQGRTVTRGVGTEPGPRGKRVLGFLRRREEALWHDPRANAVFHVALLSWPKRACSLDAFSIADDSPRGRGA